MPTAVYVEFIALRQAFLQVLQFCSVTFTPLLLDIHSSGIWTMRLLSDTIPPQRNNKKEAGGGGCSSSSNVVATNPIRILDKKHLLLENILK